MSVIEDPTAKTRLETAFELYRFAEAAMRQNLRRDHPGVSEADLDARLLRWLHSRPGAPQGDFADPNLQPK